MQNTDLRYSNDEPHHALPTSEEAQRFSPKKQTLRAWAHYKTGPITPITVSDRFYRPVDTLLLALNGDTESSEGDAR